MSGHNVLEGISLCLLAKMGQKERMSLCPNWIDGKEYGMNRADYQKWLLEPEKGARCKTRWWWYGCKVKEEEICYQLDEMKAAGIGGVEIQITYPLQAGDDNIEYFSPEYFRILRFTSRELRKRDMTMDVTLGSSWPFGGPFVPFKKSAVTVIPLELNVEGPCSFSYDFTNRISGEIEGIIMGKMDGCRMIPESVVDLEGYLTDKLLYNWPWGIRLDGVEVPEGNWKIVVFVASQFREHVLMPTRGAQGYVIDHNNREAMRFFLEHAGTPIAQKLGRGAVDDFFCDSLEVFGHNWAIDLFPEFEKRRGYDLKPYIYALWGEMRGITDRIRYDFHKTLSELTVEGFFKEMTNWCHEVGSKSRIQAHGTWGDVLLTYAAADVPEGETFSAWDKFSVNTVHRRLASSAGHLYGRNVISNESFTWLRFPRFTETPEQIKIAADSIFVDGMNQIVNHGYSYSPREGEPLYFYASSTINHTNTWWKYFHHIGTYLQRVSFFLQQGRPVAKLCIYLPQSDIWAENPLSDVHMCMKLEEKLETAAVDRIAHRGYWFDYINDDAICSGAMDRNAYEALIIMETVRMPAETVRRVREFARSGGLVICAGDLPAMDVGLYGSFDVAGAFREMEAEDLLVHVADKWEALTDVLEERLVPDLCVPEGNGQGDIGYVHRQIDGADVYFVANMSLHAYPEVPVRIRSRRRPLMVLDPMNGEELRAELLPEDTDEIVTLRLNFREGQSALIIFDEQMEDAATDLAERPGDKGNLCLLASAPSSEETDLSGGWYLEVPERSLSMNLDTLTGFEQLPQLKYYSGEAVYRRSFVIGETEISGRYVLEAEQVHDTGEVWVNGTHVTDWIMRPWTADVTDAVHPGENVLEIRVSNLLINRFLDPEKRIYEYPDEILEQWPYFPQELIKERGKRLDNWRELEMVKEVFPSGLIGRVQLMHSQFE